MTTSETWNQGFEQIRFDPQQGHLVAQDHLNPPPRNANIFGSQELSTRGRIISRQQSQQNTINYHNSQQGSGRGQERYEYSQTQLGPSTSQLRKGEESQLEQKSIRILDHSHNSNKMLEPKGRSIEPQIVHQAEIAAQQTQTMFHQQGNRLKINTQQRGPPHYPPTPPPQNIPPAQEHPRRPSGFNQLQTQPVGTQQSYAPSQKTLVMPHVQTLTPNNPVYRSHVTTQRFQSQIVQRPQKNHLLSPNKVNVEIGSMVRPQGGVWSVMHNSNIPQGSNNFSEHNIKINEGQWWRDKYEDQRRHIQAIRAQDRAEFQSACNHITLIQRENAGLKDNLEKLIPEYQKRLQEIKQLRNRIKQPPSGQEHVFKKQLEERGMLINLLKKQNQQLKERVEQCKSFESQIQSLQQTISIMKMELEQKEYQIMELKKSDNSLKPNDYSQLYQSRAQSTENTRIIEMQMQNGRLMAEINARDEAHEQEMKLSTSKINQLVDKFHSTIAQKDQNIRVLHEKVSILESDLNKKDSLLRNLRDQLVESERKKGKGSPHHSNVLSPTQGTSSSAINPPIERGDRAEKDDSKRQKDNLRKQLFDKERQISIKDQRQQQLRQLLEETEKIALKRKVQIQVYKRQISDLEDQLAQYQLMKDKIVKKNTEINEMRSLLLEKEEHSGQYQFLTRQNQKFKQLILKKNYQLSDLDFQLRQVEKKLRQQEGYNPKIDALQQEVQNLNNHLRAYQSQVQRLNTVINHGEQRVNEAELQVVKQQNRYNQLQNQINNNNVDTQQLQQQLQISQQRYQLLERELEGMASKVIDKERELQQCIRENNALKKEIQDSNLFVSELEVELKKVSDQYNLLTLNNIRSQKQLGLIQKVHTDQITKRNNDVHYLSGRNKELQAQLKLLKQRLARVQPDMQEMRQKVVKHRTCEKVIKELNNKVNLYEERMLKSPYARRLFDDMAIPGCNVFQNKIIYELKQQNEGLKGYVSKSKSPSPRIQTQSPQIMSRLNQFANNLEEAINQKSTMRKSRSQDHFVIYSPRTQSSKITSRKGQRIFTQSVENEVGSNILTIGHLQKLYNQKIELYRGQIRQLQDRNQTLMRINQDFKGKISNATNDKNSEMKQFFTSSINFERQKIQKLKKQLNQSHQKIQKLENTIKQYKNKNSFSQSPLNVSYNYNLKTMTSDFYV